MKRLLASDEISSPPCPVCGVREKELLYKVFDHEFATSDDVFDLNKCSSCGTTYLSPRPNEKAFKIIYPDDYGNYHTKSEELSYVQRVSHLRQSKKIKSLVSSLIHKSEFSVLDVGCGDGFFLDRIKEAFPSANTFGIEPDATAARIVGMSHGIFNGFIEDFKTDKKYDLIISSHVIEHLADPVNFLRNVSKFLNVGGKIIIDTPNLSCLQSRIFSKHWGGIHAPRHWTLFDQKSLLLSADRAGLKVKLVQEMPLNVFWPWSVHSLLYSWPNLRSFSDRFFNTREVLTNKSLYYFSLILFSEGLEQLAGVFRLGQGQLRVVLENE